MVTTKARIRVHDDYESIVPILIPELDEGAWISAGELRAWERPGRARHSAGPPNITRSGRLEPPLDSKLPFTPADFCIGESGVWWLALHVGTRQGRPAR